MKRLQPKQPPRTRKEYIEFYNRDHELFDTSERYGDIVNWERFRDIFNYVQGPKVLDVGCNGGGITLELAKRGYEMTGIDICKAYIKKLRKKIEQQQFKYKPKLILGLIEDMKFGAKFDTVIVTEVLEHCENPQEVLKKCFQALKSGGVLIGTVPYPKHPQGMWYLKQGVEEHIWVIDKPDLEEMLKKYSDKFLVTQIRESFWSFVAWKR